MCVIFCSKRLGLFVSSRFNTLDANIVHLMPDLPTILIADDDPIFLGITAAMVQSMGFSAITAVDGIDALQSFTKNEKHIGYVLLDINMPKMNGIAVFQRIRNLCHRVKIVIVSGCINDAMRAQLSPLRPTAYLKKPVSFEELSTILTSLSPR